MNIDYLREFIEVGLSLNLSKAAKTLHVSQPSLSKHIAALEQECGTTLLKRSTSRVQLTLAGQTLIEEALKLIRLHDGALKKIASLKDVVTLNVGGLCKNALIIALINRTLAELNEPAPTVSVAYQDYRHQSYVDLLQAGKIDLAFTFLGADEKLPARLGSALLFRDPMICLVKEGHPYAGRERLHIAELENQVILQPVGSYSTDHGKATVRDIFSRYGIAPEQRPVFVHSISELSCVANVDDVLIMERSMLTTQPFTTDYRVLEFYEDDVAFSFYAVWDEKGTDAKPEAHRFAKEMARLAQEEA